MRGRIAARLGKLVLLASSPSRSTERRKYALPVNSSGLEHPDTRQQTAHFVAMFVTQSVDEQLGWLHHLRVRQNEQFVPSHWTTPPQICIRLLAAGLFYRSITGLADMLAKQRKHPLPMAIFRRLNVRVAIGKCEGMAGTGIDFDTMRNAPPLPSLRAAPQCVRAAATDRTRRSRNKPRS